MLWLSDGQNSHSLLTFFSPQNCPFVASNSLSLVILTITYESLFCQFANPHFCWGGSPSQCTFSHRTNRICSCNTFATSWLCSSRSRRNQLRRRRRWWLWGAQRTSCFGCSRCWIERNYFDLQHLNGNCHGTRARKDVCCAFSDCNSQCNFAC